MNNDSYSYTSRTVHCHGCENSCLVVKYDFGDGNVYYSGNRCERVFHNGGEQVVKGRNVYEGKLHLLFDRAERHPEQATMRIGIPRVLNMFEDFPLWHTLLTRCGIDVVLSAPSDMRSFEASARMVMSDNICFPAKLVHSHLDNLAAQGVDRIFFPFVIHGPKGKDQNSYNCPIVTGYSQVVQDFRIPVDSPVISMKDRNLFYKQCRLYLTSIGIADNVVRKAFNEALAEQRRFESEVAEACRSILREREESQLVVLLAGRPYHSDPLIQHGVAEMIASLGVDVISDDLMRDNALSIDDAEFLSQWTFTNRILRAAKWCAQQGADVQFVQLTSFGCGPDAFLTDPVRDLLHRYDKSLTLLKLDDICNIGSMKLRVRSLIDSLRITGREGRRESVKPFVTTPVFAKEDRRRTIIAPFFTPFISPLIPPVLKHAGYDVVCLPPSDEDSADIGLKYANNEVCYPATLVIGDIIRALQKGNYDRRNVAVAMPQTGGQCRASNYLPMLKKAMVDAGFGDIPAISISLTSGIENEQPGFTINWMKILPMALYTVVYSDVLAKLYYPAAVREKTPGTAIGLRDLYLQKAIERLAEGDYKSLLGLATEAAAAFDTICDDSVHKKVGIVGEIFLKFNPYAHRYLPQRLMEHGVEVVPPILTDLFSHYFVNRKVNCERFVERSLIPQWALAAAYRLFESKLDTFDKACRPFRYYTPFENIFHEAANAAPIISLNTQFGEGWLLPGEIASFYKCGVKNVLSLQPFGCIANHIVVRGVEKRLKSLFPDINLLCLDFDGGMSEVNIINRMLLFENNLQ